MKNKDSWNSSYRKKKFYERQEVKKEKVKQEESCEKNLFYIPSSIAVMLDLDGTCDFIDEEKARVFVKQLDFIRRKFNADFGTISISTHYNNYDRIKEILDIMAPVLTDTIKIEDSYYFGGIYDYNEDYNTPLGADFNHDKINTFLKNQVNLAFLDNKWFALIDDDLYDDVYQNYQNICPMLVCRPSKNEDDKKKNNFMSITSDIYGFDGVLEAMNVYIESIKQMSPEQILETQKNMMMHLSTVQLHRKMHERDYEFIERYLEEGYADKDDYTTIFFGICSENYISLPSKEELSILYKILNIISLKFKEMEEQEKLKEMEDLKLTWKHISKN